MSSEHGYGHISPAQDCLQSALTLMPSLCHDQELGPSQLANHSFLLPARKALLLTASLSSPTCCFMSEWAPQSERTEDFVSGNQRTGTAEISRFPTSWQNFPCVSKTLGKGFGRRICKPGGGEDLAQTVEGNADGSDYCWQGDPGNVLHWKTKTTEIKEDEKKKPWCSWTHISNSFCIFRQNSTRSPSFLLPFLKIPFQTIFHWSDRAEQIITFQTSLEDGATKFLTVVWL